MYIKYFLKILKKHKQELYKTIVLGFGFLTAQAYATIQAIEISDIAIMESQIASIQKLQTNSRTIDYPLNGVILGNGWSSISAAKTFGGCIDFEMGVNEFEDHFLDFIRIVDKEQLNRKLDISVEFKAKSVGGVGGSAKATFANSLEVKNESLNMLFTALVRKGADFAIPKRGNLSIKLSKEAEGLAKRNLAEFLKTCGDSFVATIYSGGELNAYFSFDIASMDEQQMVSAQLSGGGLSFSGSASMNQAVKQYSEKQKLHILMHSAGGSGIPIPVNEQELLDRLRNLPADTKTAPKHYKIDVVRYDSLPNWPSKSIKALKFVDLERLVAQYLRYETLYYDIFNILRKPDAYVFTRNITLESIRSVQDFLRLQVLPILKSSIEDCLDEKSCNIPKEAAALDYDTRIHFTVPKQSFINDIQLTALKNEIMSTTITYESEPEKIDIVIKGGPRVVVHLPNQKKIGLKNKLDALKANLNVLELSYQGSLAEAIFSQWIANPAFERCKNDPVSDYCLSQKDLARYKASIFENLSK